MTPSLDRPLRALGTLVLVLICAAVLPGGPARAQNLFAPVIFVNDQAITRYELDQRARMLTLFRAPGDTNRLAREQLIEERIKFEAARAIGLTLPDDMVQEGMEEFAGRANMTGAELIAGLAQSGVSEESFRAFVRAGVTWREVTRARFASQVSVSDAEIDRATRALSGRSPVRVLMSEIVLPVRSLEEAESQQTLAARIATSRSESEFAAYARRHSAAPSAGNGGRMAWRALSDLPPGLRQIALSLAPGEVSEPLPVENGIALIMLRDIEEGEPPEPQYSAIEYAAYYIPGGRSEAALARAAQVRAEVDTAWPMASRPRCSSAAPRRPRRSLPISPPSWRGSIPARSRQTSPAPMARRWSFSCSAVARPSSRERNPRSRT